MEKVIMEFNKSCISGYVLDLWGNLGGLLFFSIDIVCLWFNWGEIVSIIDWWGGDCYFLVNGRSFMDLFLVVLVNEWFVSVSEILVGVLKE